MSMMPPASNDKNPDTAPLTADDFGPIPLGMPEDVDPGDFAANATDHAWSCATGNCGGCGNQSCHPGRPCDGDYCRLCQHRRAQGLVR